MTTVHGLKQQLNWSDVSIAVTCNSLKQLLIGQGHDHDRDHGTRVSITGQGHRCCGFILGTHFLWTFNIIFRGSSFHTGACKRQRHAHAQKSSVSWELRLIIIISADLLMALRFLTPTLALVIWLGEITTCAFMKVQILICAWVWTSCDMLSRECTHVKRLIDV